MKRIATLAAALLAAALLMGAAAQAYAEDAGEFSQGSKAKNWNLLGQENAMFEARVVDILCVLTGDCVDNCGDGRRQLGLLRKADGKLVMVNKNTQPVFTGATEDLLPYCDQDVEVDGLLVGHEDFTPAKFYQIQFIRRVGDETWNKTDKWTKVWARKNPEANEKKGPWFRKDPRVMALIERDGYLGLGLEQDEAFKTYLFEE